MKVTELMIGDWVFITSVCGWECDPITQQIRAIEFNSYEGDDYCDWVSTDCDDEVSLSDIEPIPLTAEILEKNGFYVYDKDDYSDAKLDINVDEDNLYQISINRKGDNYHIAIHYIKWLNHKTGNYDSQCLYSNGLFSDFKPLYVHELQHALRLCGLNELANNFKI